MIPLHFRNTFNMIYVANRFKVHSTDGMKGASSAHAGWLLVQFRSITRAGVESEDRAYTNTEPGAVATGYREDLYSKGRGRVSAA